MGQKMDVMGQRMDPGSWVGRGVAAGATWEVPRLKLGHIGAHQGNSDDGPLRRYYWNAVMLEKE
jgi:hypothetical protein